MDVDIKNVNKHIKKIIKSKDAKTTLNTVFSALGISLWLFRYYKLCFISSSMYTHSQAA